MIIIKLMGGMGNQMFQYAFGRSLSLKKGVTLKLDLNFLLDRTPKKNFVFRDYDLTIFNCKPQILTEEDKKSFFGSFIMGNKYFNKILPIRNRKFYTESRFEYDTNVHKLNEDIYLEGYWQSYKYFSEFESTIRKDFSFKNKFNEEEEVINQRILSTNSVCINVRRSDFLVNSFHGVCNEEYFYKGLNYINNSESELNVFVFSDDIEWCKNNLNFEFPTNFIDHEYAGEKFQSYLQLMTNCKHFIIPNSSFGWWAAWLANFSKKIVVAPKKWFSDSNINTKDLIPDDWIRI